MTLDKRASARGLVAVVMNHPFRVPDHYRADAVTNPNPVSRKRARQFKPYLNHRQEAGAKESARVKVGKQESPLSGNFKGGIWHEILLFTLLFTMIRALFLPMTDRNGAEIALRRTAQRQLTGSLGVTKCNPGNPPDGTGCSPAQAILCSNGENLSQVDSLSGKMFKWQSRAWLKTQWFLVAQI